MELHQREKEGTGNLIEGTTLNAPHQEDNCTHLNQNETTMERIQETHALDVWTKIDLAP